MKYLLQVLLLLAMSIALLQHQVRAADSAEEEEEDYANDDDYGGQDGDDEEDGDEETYTGPPPVIHSRARELSVKPGETIRFPCEVEHADEVSLMWLKDTQMLFTDQFRSITDKRFEKKPDNTLQISGVKPSDAGRYICQLGIKDKPKVVHVLHILETPKIVKLLPGPFKELHKGTPLTLECTVSGYPAPTVTWSRKDKDMPDGEEAVEGNAITFDSVTRKHSGVYECMASNGIGEPATATVDVRVAYSPEIEIEREIVNSEEGYDAELVCEVHAEPKAKVAWFKDGQVLPIRGQDRLVVTKQGSRHILQISKTTKADFGSYTCHANNSHGRIDRVIRLSGEPSPAKYVSTTETEEGGRILEWVVESHSPINSYELKYKNKQMSDWKKVHPVVTNPEGNVYKVTYELKDLPSGHYEAVLRAQNVYGWSEASIVHMFDIKMPSRVVLAGASGLAEPAMGETSDAAAAQSPLLALLTILSLSTFFL